MEDLKAEGVSIVYISHKMDEILRISDEVTIMRDGQYVGTWESKNLTTDFIITKMVGRELTNLYPKRENVPGEVVFEVEDFTSINPKSFRHCSFKLRKGEILGVGGLVGASAILSACGEGNKMTPLKQPGEFYVPELPDKAIDGKELKVGLIGCGGRGSGAAMDFLAAANGVITAFLPPMPPLTTLRPNNNTLCLL